MARSRAPDAGDVVWLSLDPQAGHEQAGHRPALVLSPAPYNQKSGLIVCCPFTARSKGHPFEVLTELDGVPCAVLSDQTRSLDWVARRARIRGRVDDSVLMHVRAKLKALLQIP